jgi:ABC-type branched-subunit amino acid transport system ATPase component
MQKHNNAGASFAATTPMKPGSAKPDPILIADKITRQFGGLTAVNVDHLEIQRGSITALIGPNGAGKTTFFNLLTGYDAPNSGTWSFNGIALNGVPPHKVARLGMVRTFQLTKALYRLTVIENMAWVHVAKKVSQYLNLYSLGSGVRKRLRFAVRRHQSSRTSSYLRSKMILPPRYRVDNESFSKWLAL